MVDVLWERIRGGWQVLLAPGDGDVHIIPDGDLHVEVNLTDTVVHWVRIYDHHPEQAWLRNMLDLSYSRRDDQVRARLRTTSGPVLAIAITVDPGHGPTGTVYVLYERDPEIRFSELVLTGPIGTDTASALEGSAR